MTKERLGKFVAERRKELGMTQKDLATAINITDKAVSKWERGLSYPDITLLEPLANALSLRVEELMTCQVVEKEDISMADETRNLLEISAATLDIERKSKQRLLTVLIVLIFMVLGGMIFWRQSLLISEIRSASVVMKETEGEKQYLYVQEYGHLLRLECDDTVDFESITTDEQVYELTCRWNKRTYQGTVTKCEHTGGIVLGSIMDAEFEVLSAPMFGHGMVYYTWENYVPNLYANETGIRYLHDFRCWLWNEETDGKIDILIVEDCGAVLVEDIDGDGEMEVVVRTRWPEKPYTIYDGDGGSITERWPESVDSDVAETLERMLK